MEFEFDPEKNERNLALRGLSFELAQELEWHHALLWHDTRHHQESRESALAPLEGRLYFVAFTVRGTKVRVISFRKAKKREVRNDEETKR
jgi:uncharacterized DUF497 family protein